jgi:FkbM family methyltransferase
MNGIEILKNDVWVVANDTHISQWVKEHGTLACDPHLFGIMKQWLDIPEVSTIWDIGANIGDHTIFYLSLGKNVVAIEPNPIAFKCLEHNCPQAILHNIAASNQPGVLSFAQHDNVGASYIGADGTLNVSAVSLDSMNLPDPQFVKMDVEGWEPYAIAGMSETLKRCKPKVFVEVNKSALARNKFTYHDVLNPFKELGYSNYTLFPENSTYDDEQYDVLITFQ